ncbi:glycosyltransferase [Tamaricihabitans halophyticus]|nr:glycosyltransferase [Tamaricihabitans halophyticus]
MHLGCTITREAELPRARVLADSYLRAHPDHEFVIAVLDAPRGTPERTAGGVRILGPGEFGVDTDTYLRLATGYRPAELTSAVKPLLLRHLRGEAELVCYLDQRMWVAAALPELPELTARHGIVVTPYFTRRLPADYAEFDEAALVGSGQLSPALVAVGAGGDELLAAWALAATRFTLTAPDSPQWPEQTWFDRYLPSYGAHVWLDESVHIACWNAAQRAESEPRLVNFLGYDPDSPYLLSTYCQRRPSALLSELPALHAVADAYGTALRAAGRPVESAPSWLDELPDGTPLDPVLRNLFRVTWQRYTETIERDRNWPDVPPPAHAFANGGADFREWLASPAEHAQSRAGLNRWAMVLYESRVDLQLAFALPTTRDAESFREWCRNNAVADGLLAEWAAPSEPEAPRSPDTAFGVNLLGHLTAELGVGELGRTLHTAITRAELPSASVVEDQLIANRAGHQVPADAGAPRFGVTVVAVNADLTEKVADQYPEALRDRYVIGVWSWELDEFPESMHHAFDLVDEVWTISEFCRQAIAKHTDKPVRVFPIPVRASTVDDQRREPGKPPRFLFAFDYNSIAERKNPWAVIEAFQRAFPEGEPAELVLKTINADRAVAEAERLRALAHADPRITLLEQYLDTAELAELYAGADCYISLHRSEGFGFTVAEAIAHGLPVICTDYSGTSEFVPSDAAWLIGHTMVEVGPGLAPYPARARWAEPDVTAAAEALRAVAADPAAAADRGRIARETVLRARSMDAAADWVAEQLTRAHADWLANGGPAAATQEEAEEPATSGELDEPLARLRAAREALRWRAEADTPSRIPGAPLLRKAVLRALDHYDAHNRRVLNSVLDGVESAFTQVVAQVAELQARLDENAPGSRSDTQR